MAATKKGKVGDPKRVAHLALDRIAIVRAEGHVDRAGIEACDYLVARAGPDIQGAVVDLSLAEHLDYRAVTLLVARRMVLQRKGAELAVAAARREVRDVLRLAAGSQLKVFASVEEAIGWVRGDQGVAVASAARVARAR